MLKDHKKITLLIPVYNEETAIAIFLDEVSKILKPIDNLDYEFLFVNDGSTDSTLEMLIEQKERFKNIIIIDFSRNFGKEAALTAALDLAKGDAVIPIDVDLQDPPEVIIDMLALWEDGADVVLGKRIDRSDDSFLKRITANWFYKIHNYLSEHKIPENVGDFRLMSHQVVQSIKRVPENQRFMKGLMSWVGFKVAFVEYKRQKRISGKSKFNYWKLWNFALDGITNYGISPLRIWTYVGLVVTIPAFGFMLYVIAAYFISNSNVDGYASIMVSITFLGGLQLIGIGVIGEYLGRTYMETKKRPIYIIKKII